MTEWWTKWICFADAFVSVCVSFDLSEVTDFQGEGECEWAREMESSEGHASNVDSFPFNKRENFKIKRPRWSFVQHVRTIETGSVYGRLSADVAVIYNIWNDKRDERVKKKINDEMKIDFINIQMEELIIIIIRLNHFIWCRLCAVPFSQITISQ